MHWPYFRQEPQAAHVISPSSGGSFWARAPSNAPAPLWPSSVISSNLEPVPPSGGLSRESPCYTGKLRPQKARGRAQPQPGHPLCPSRPVPPPLRPSSRQCSTEMSEGGKLSSVRTICVYTAGAAQTPETGSQLRSQPTKGRASWSHSAPRVRRHHGHWFCSQWQPGNHPALDGGPAWKTRSLGSLCRV